ncbi:MAG TPA: histidine kinase, partial [Thermomicrobiales bacterium]|nr:histidine kinase [Thermomicrobiales bacterium]
MSHLYDRLPRLAISKSARDMTLRTLLALFSWLWVLQILIPLQETWRDESSRNVRIGVTALAVAFIAAYTSIIFRMYFYRRSWSVIFTTRERWILRAIVTGISIALVFWQGNAWALTLVFSAITIIITAPPLRAFTAIFQAMIAITAVLLLAPVEQSMRFSVLAISFVLGLLIASQLQQGGQMGELIEARYREARIAASDERLRIARDLHDVLGHTLSLVTLKSELASRLVDADPARAQQEMREVERIARSAMAEVRRTVAGERQLVLASEIDAARQLLAAADIDL